MKRVLRHYAVDTFSLWATTKVAAGIFLEQGIETLMIAGLGFMAVSLLAKPIINLLLLPLNLVTFGVFRWLSSAIVLYLVTLIVPGFKITAFIYHGFESKWFDIPSLNLEGLLAYIAFAFVISALTSFIYWLIK